MMKKITLSSAIFIVLTFAINGCKANSPSPVPTEAAVPPTLTIIPSTPTLTTIPNTPTLTPIPEGKTIIVISAGDSGPGTLRQTLQDARAGDRVIFDPVVFNPQRPTTIRLMSGLTAINQGYLLLDASNAGVILDGSQAGGKWTPGIELNSDHNTILGLQVVHFTGPGLLINPSGNFNTIGGNRKTGVGPLGQGNLFSDTSDGIGIKGSDNWIMGNFIGTDVTGSGKMGSRAPGIFLEENASRNVIGPNNIIAFNGTRGYGGGVEIRSLDAKANVITANAIHDNTAPGIYYNINWGDQTEFSAVPIIFDFDLTSGMVKGVTCPDCVVEIFSTNTADGEIYEGTATADQNGVFLFTKKTPFTGPHLTANATPVGGNTGEFSAPTSGIQRFLTIQKGNESPRSIFEVKTSIELGDNHIGQLFDKLYLIEDLQGILRGEINSLGTKYVKLTITEAEALTVSGETEEPVRWDVSEYSFSPDAENFIKGLADHKITVDYLLNFWDKANHPEGWRPSVSRFKTQEEIDHYLEYVRFIVGHFKGRVTYYEIWNEPNNTEPLQWIQANDYINLVRQTVPVIRQEDPDARIVVGGTTSLSNPESQKYLFTLLNSDIMPLVDVLSWHPFYAVSPKHSSDFYYAYPTLVQKIKETAAVHGFTGSYRADEILYRSPDCYWCDPGDPLDSNITAAKYYARGIILNLGMNLGVGVAGSSSLRRESYQVIQNLCTLMAEAEPDDLPVEITSKAANLRYYVFSLPEGENLVAIWTDGKAMDDDPGVEAAITIPGYAGRAATGVDILNGIKQKLSTNDEDGNLVIRDLLIKDYPMIIRLSK